MPATADRPLSATPLRQRLGNGITVLITPCPGSGIVAAQGFLRRGSAGEAEPGSSRLLAAMLTRGTTRRSARDLAEYVESIGASLGAEANGDYFSLGFRAIAADLPGMLTLTAEILREASLPEDQLDLERRLHLQSIRAQREQCLPQAFQQLRRGVYGGHPYAEDGLGTEASVSGLGPESLRQLYRDRFRPEELVISLAGDLDPERTLVLLEQLLGDWSAADAAPESVALQTPVQATPQVLEFPFPGQQLYVLLGAATVPVDHPDQPALKLASSYLGNGMSSRLFVELREKQGLAYEVSALHTARRGPGAFAAYLGTAPENGAIALQGLQREWLRLVERGLSEAELAATVRKHLGQYALSRQTMAQLAQTFGYYETLGLGWEYDRQYPELLRAVTPEHLRSACQRWLATPTVCLAGPAAALESAV
jgi:predicted Zn-dependent peptidase